LFGAKSATAHLDDLHDLGDSVDAVFHNAFDAGLQSLVRSRTRGAGPDQFDRDDTGLFVDVMQDDVSAVGLKSWSYDHDGFFYLLAH